MEKTSENDRVALPLLQGNLNADANPSTESSLASGPIPSFVLCMVFMTSFSTGKKNEISMGRVRFKKF